MFIHTSLLLYPQAVWAWQHSVPDTNAAGKLMLIDSDPFPEIIIPPVALHWYEAAPATTGTE